MDLDEPNKLLFSEFTSENIPNYPTIEVKQESVSTEYRMELSTKKAVELLLEGTLRTKVCRYCLNIASSLSELDQILQIAGKGAFHKVTIRDMVASFYPFKVLNDTNFPNRICNKCLNRTISAYLFTQQCEQSERALHNCFEDIFNKMEKLDPLDRTKKRGRQKLNPNYNVLYADHQRVIDYAEPMINIVNVKSVSLSKEKYISDLECPKCWQVFSKLDDLIIHEKSHPTNMWFNCRLCGKSFVKRMQLKKHWKQQHLTPDTKPEIEVESNFKCGTCGFTSDNHSIYLHHIEKHKFQSVLEHLVEKNMDKLCAVCLDKSPKMVELDNMVQLYGGYPGVTGDKTVYSILGSTLPDQKSYKYQELYVPHHAKILKFAKLTKEKQQKESIDNSVSNFNQIIISNPLIISNEKFDCDEMYLFFFSNPSYMEDRKEINSVYKKKPNKTVIQCGEEDGNYLSMKETNNIEVLEKRSENINKDVVETMNDALKIQNVEINSNILDANNIQLDIKDATPFYDTKCKTCWIFNKPTCKICVSKQVNAGEARQVDWDSNAVYKYNNASNEGTYSWIFRTSDKYNNVSINNLIDGQDTKIEGENVDFQRKRKLIDDNNMKHKKEKWNCQICLTTNIEERQTCICCESNKNIQDNLSKVNLITEHPFKIFKTDDTTKDKNKIGTHQRRLVI